MTSYLELKALGLTLEPRVTGPAIDRQGHIPATDGTLRAVGPKSEAHRIRIAVEERLELARQVLAGGFAWLNTERGICDVCGQAQEDYRSGMCLLCVAAVQKVRKKS